MTTEAGKYQGDQFTFKTKLVRPPVRERRSRKSSKVLVNPYQGCSHRCLFCPANDGFLRRKAFDEFRNDGTIRVVENILDHVAAYVRTHPEAKIAHISPIADPFQPVESEFRLVSQVLNYCASIRLPVALCSKGIIPEDAQRILLAHPLSFAQVSIISAVEEKRRFIVRGNGASVKQLLDLVSQMTAKGICVIARIDPIFPGITDDLDEFRRLVGWVRERGVQHVVSSVADIVVGSLERESGYLDSYSPGLSEIYRDLYVEQIGGRLHARIGYRRRLFAVMSSVCREMGISFGITWEPAPDGTSLASEFSFGASENRRSNLT